MKKLIIEPRQKNEIGMDVKIYDHYKDRKPTPLPDPIIVKGIDVTANRAGDITPSYELIDLAEREIIEKDFERDGYMFRSYTPAGVKKNATCLFYIHGGGFVMGTLDRLNNINRRIADVLDGVVIHVDYTMAPEAAYPVAVNQSLDAIHYVAEHAEEFGIDPEKIVVMGDSAGGNLTTTISYEDSKADRLVKMQILFYPLVDFTNTSVDKFDLSYYGENLDPLVVKKILQMKGLSFVINAYIQNQIALDDERVSAYCCKDCSVYPPTLVVTAEYDFLRRQSEEFAEMLNAAGVDTEYVMYAGSFHGFIERVGVFDQSDDSIHLMVDRINRILG